MDNSTFKISLQVRSYEMDSFGHVNNATYLNYLEFARCEYMHQRNLSFNDFQKWKKYPYVIKTEITYRSAARADDILEIKGKISLWKRSSFIIQYEIWNTTTDKLCALSEMAFVFVNGQEKVIAIPEEFKNAMS